MLLTVTRLSLSHAGLASQSVGVWGVPPGPAAGGKRKMVFRGVCVYYCRTYYKAVRGGGGGEWTTCAMIDDEPRPVWMSPLIANAGGREIVGKKEGGVC